MRCDYSYELPWWKTHAIKTMHPLKYTVDLEDQLKLDCSDEDFKESKEARMARRVVRKHTRKALSYIKTLKRSGVI